jgi:hypothetical protein
MVGRRLHRQSYGCASAWRSSPRDGISSSCSARGQGEGSVGARHEDHSCETARPATVFPGVTLVGFRARLGKDVCRDGDEWRGGWGPPEREVLSEGPKRCYSPLLRSTITMDLSLGNYEHTAAQLLPPPASSWIAQRPQRASAWSMSGAGRGTRRCWLRRAAPVSRASIPHRGCGSRHHPREIQRLVFVAAEAGDVRRNLRQPVHPTQPAHCCALSAQHVEDALPASSRKRARRRRWRARSPLVVLCEHRAAAGRVPLAL